MVAALLLALLVAPPALLPHRPGWHLGSAQIKSQSCRRCVQQDTWGATVPYRDAPNDFPHKTMETLGRNDLIVLITRSWQPSPPAWMLKTHPLTIHRAQIHAGFEGNTTHGRVSLWGSSTWHNGSFLTVYVFFGSPHPPAAAITKAQQELDRTRFPRWIIKT